MRAVVAALLMALSLALLVFVAMKWLPVVWEDGFLEAYDQLVSSTLNMISTVVLIGTGILTFAAAVFAAPHRQNPSN